jgi:hypothetical protein
MECLISASGPCKHVKLAAFYYIAIHRKINLEDKQADILNLFRGNARKEHAMVVNAFLSISSYNPHIDTPIFA